MSVKRNHGVEALRLCFRCVFYRFYGFHTSHLGGYSREASHWLCWWQYVTHSMQTSSYMRGVKCAKSAIVPPQSLVFRFTRVCKLGYNRRSVSVNLGFCCRSGVPRVNTRGRRVGKDRSPHQREKEKQNSHTESMGVRLWVRPNY